jgi:hypothetical protein
MASKVTVTFTDKDKGFRRMAADLGSVASIDLGVFGSAARRRHPGHGKKGTITVGQLAAQHEFGLGGMPQRSFIRAWMDKNEEQMRADARTALSAVARKGSRKAIFNALGEKWASSVRAFIFTGKVTPPNAIETVIRKGHDTPLIGTTYTLMKAVAAKVTLAAGHSSSTYRAMALYALRLGGALVNQDKDE